MSLCVFIPLDEQKPWRLTCANCGRPTRALSIDPDRFMRNCEKDAPRRTDAEVFSIVAICAACPMLRDHERAGAYCTHKNCRCHPGTAAGMLGGVRINSGLAEMIRRGGTRCPAGKW